MTKVKAICIEGVCVALPNNWSNTTPLPEKFEDLLEDLNLRSPENGFPDDKVSFSLLGLPADTEKLFNHNVYYDPWIKFSGNIDVTGQHPRVEELLDFLRYFIVEGKEGSLFHVYQTPEYFETSAIDRDGLQQRMNSALQALQAFDLFPPGTNREMAIILRDQSSKMVNKGVGGYFLPDDIGLPAVVLSQGNRDNEGSLRHELVHAYLGLFDPNVPSWLTEGFAELVEHFDPALSASERLSYPGYNSHYFSPLEDITSTGEDGKTKPLNYEVVHSFFMFLEETRGREKLMEFVQLLRESGNAEASLFKAMGSPDLKTLQDEFQIWVLQLFSMPLGGVFQERIWIGEQEITVSFPSKNLGEFNKSKRKIIEAFEKRSDLPSHILFSFKEDAHHIDYGNPKLYKITFDPTEPSETLSGWLLDMADYPEKIRKARLAAADFHPNFFQSAAEMEEALGSDSLKLAQTPRFWAYLEFSLGKRETERLWKLFLYKGLYTFQAALPKDVVFQFTRTIVGYALVYFFNQAPARDSTEDAARAVLAWLNLAVEEPLGNCGEIPVDEEDLLEWLPDEPAAASFARQVWMKVVRLAPELRETMDERCLVREGNIQAAPFIQPRFSPTGYSDLKAGVGAMVLFGKSPEGVASLHLRAGDVTGMGTDTQAVDLSAGLRFQSRLSGFYGEFGAGRTFLLQNGEESIFAGDSTFL
ncbi:MAG: hypothetical protein Q7T11_00605, partial [Deltaproteobacteria bacterium]|nr:hypothetical protein [Deltaproteobacteria bacterium]